MSSEPIIIFLFIVASGVAFAAGRWNLPYTVALVVVGLILGSMEIFQAPELTHDLLFLVFLPGLIFEAAYHIKFDELWRDRAPILSLAIPGVVVSIVLTALLLLMISSGMSLMPAQILPPIEWPLALIFGAAIAATDPVAVVSIFRNLGAPPRLNLLIEGESLLNDGTAIVFFGLMLSILVGSGFSTDHIVIEFVMVVGGGLLIGGIVGTLISLALRQIDDPMIEIMLTTVAAYGSFLVADQIAFSGVISTVVAGLVCGNYGAKVGMSPSTRIAVHAFWEYLAFMLNSLIFLLIGLEVKIDSLYEIWPVIFLAYLAVTISRFIIVYAVSYLLSFTKASIPTPWIAILSWGGLRGALSMVLVLSLPFDLPNRTLVINMVFGVVLLSILFQGMSISWLGRKLGILGVKRTLADYEKHRVEIQLSHRVLEELKHLEKMHLYDKTAVDRLIHYYTNRFESAKSELHNLSIDRELRSQEDLMQLSRRLLLCERSHLLELRQSGRISMQVAEELLADIDARLLDLESGELFVKKETLSSEDEQAATTELDENVVPNGTRS